MSVLIVFLYALVVVVSLLLIGLILIQPSKSGGMGAAFGGIGESMFGGKAGSHLTKATVWLTAVFMVLSLALAVLIGHGYRMESSGSGVSRELDSAKDAVKAVEKKAPAAPAAEKKGAAAKNAADKNKK
ncbi:MAG: preprotein translocase subunit SecG [Lentisphaeria bacterium]|nr:preprotein translocase subunit SecG [Lentisphaeria bacterium]